MKIFGAQMVKMFKLRDDETVRQYKVVSRDYEGVATIYKDSLEYFYEGDDMGKWTRFVEDQMIRSVQQGIELPDKIVHGVG